VYQAELSRKLTNKRKRKKQQTTSSKIWRQK